MTTTLTECAPQPFVPEQAGPVAGLAVPAADAAPARPRGGVRRALRRAAPVRAHGYSATVFLSNLFCLPDKEEEILALPHEAFDTPEEVFEAHWRVD